MSKMSQLSGMFDDNVNDYTVARWLRNTCGIDPYEAFDLTAHFRLQYNRGKTQ